LSFSTISPSRLIAFDVWFIADAVAWNCGSFSWSQLHKQTTGTNEVSPLTYEYVYCIFYESAWSCHRCMSTIL